MKCSFVPIMLALAAALTGCQANRETPPIVPERSAVEGRVLLPDSTVAANALVTCGSDSVRTDGQGRYCLLVWTGVTDTLGATWSSSQPHFGSRAGTVIVRPTEPSTCGHGLNRDILLDQYVPI